MTAASRATHPTTGAPRASTSRRTVRTSHFRCARSCSRPTDDLTPASSAPSPSSTGARRGVGSAVMAAGPDGGDGLLDGRPATGGQVDERLHDSRWRAPSRRLAGQLLGRDLTGEALDVQHDLMAGRGTIVAHVDSYPSRRDTIRRQGHTVVVLSPTLAPWRLTTTCWR